MSVTLRYLGWSAIEVTLEDGRRIVLDPLLNGVAEQGVPPSPAKIEEFDGVDVVMVTHVAADHVGQAFEILARSRARLVCDVATRFMALAAGIAPERVISMVPGVQLNLDGLLVKALPAEHLSFKKLAENAYISGPPLSYLVTTLTELYPDEAALVAKWLGVKAALPIHYRFDEGISFARELKKRAPRVKAVLLQAGESYTVESKTTRAVSGRRPAARTTQKARG